ncbi:MAG: hypothetical protein ACTSVI_03855 [Promethearchaeota archaeon]
MPIAWDAWFCVVTGFGFSSLPYLLEDHLDKKIKAGWIYFFGLLMTQFLNVTVSVWCWTDVDQNWLLLYTMDPGIFGNAVHLIYVTFPLIYSLSFAFNSYLIKTKKNFAGLFFVATTWIIFTCCVAPGFFTLFSGDDTSLHSIDYPPQLIWNLTSYPDKNALWAFPLDLRAFFIMFTIIVIGLLVIFEILGVLLLIVERKREKSNEEEA